MISALVLDPYGGETDLLKMHLKRLSGRLTDERLTVHMAGTAEKARGLLGELDFLKMALIDVTVNNGLDVAREVRKTFPDSEILIVADTSISPMRYLQPEIRACSLLLRPFSQTDISATMADYFRQAVKDLEEKSEEVFWIKTREGTQKIPMYSICWFEAREKKLAARTRRDTYMFSGTIDKLAEELPENFVRCHRSFLVNRSMIRAVRLTEGEIELDSGLVVPLSRSYKKDLKEYMHGHADS